MGRCMIAMNMSAVMSKMQCRTYRYFCKPVEVKQVEVKLGCISRHDVTLIILLALLDFGSPATRLARRSAFPAP